MVGRMKLEVALVLGLIVAGCGEPPDRVPERLRFSQDGDIYEWALAHGVVGSLSLNTIDASGHGRPLVLMTCEDRSWGGLSAPYFERRDAEIRIVTDDAVFVLEPTTGRAAGEDARTARGAFPSGWFQALARTQTVEFFVGGNRVIAPGPGAEAADHFKRYCTKLARRRQASAP